jgi:hypothetical protein
MNANKKEKGEKKMKIGTKVIFKNTCGRTTKYDGMIGKIVNIKDNGKHIAKTYVVVLDDVVGHFDCSVDNLKKVA